MAQLLRADLLPEAWIAPPAVRQLRALLRHRVQLVRLRTLLRNRIHAVLADHGHGRPGGCWSGPGRAWLASLELPAASREVIEDDLAVADNVFVATGTTVFKGARIGTRSEIRVNAVVHLRTHVPPGTTVPIGWIAVGDPAQLFPPSEHERLWQVQRELDFPGYVFGLPRAAEGDTTMPELERRYSRALGHHQDDQIAGKES